MKITFYNPHLGLRGTEVMMYDYAFYGRKFYNWDIQVLYNKQDKRSDQLSIDKFKKEFDVYEIDCDPKNFSLINHEIEKFLEKHPSDYFYTQKGGPTKQVNPSNSKTCILRCSIVDPKEDKHGHSYAFVSDWLSKKCSNSEIPVVPAIIELPNTMEDFRQEFKIPKNAIVFGRTGGVDTWNIEFVNEVICDILKSNENIYFIFQNTPNFLDHERIIHINNSFDKDFKSKFINTCDAFIHARMEGETFGLSCAEFSLKNKRVITYSKSRENNHTEILGNKGLYYSSPRGLFNILSNFIPEPEKDWNCYKEFSAEKVMKIFQDVFIDKKDHFHAKKDHAPAEEPKKDTNIVDTPSVGVQIDSKLNSLPAKSNKKPQQRKRRKRSKKDE